MAIKNKVYLGSDHAGFLLKESLKKYLASINVPFQDLGNMVHDLNDDYPDFSYKVASTLYLNPGSFGVICCGSSFGACIAANKVNGARAVAVRSANEAKLAREHNDANILCLAGGGMREGSRGMALSKKEAQKVVKAFLTTPFSKAERHRRRVEKIKDLERKNFT